MARFEDVMLSEQEIRERSKLKKGRPTTLGDLVDFDKLKKRLEGEEKPSKSVIPVKPSKSVDPLSYINESIEAMNADNLSVICVPPDTVDLAIMKNWICYTGHVEKVESFGFTPKFFVNKTFLRCPCLIVKENLLRKMNDLYREMDKKAQELSKGKVRKAYTARDLRVRSVNPLVTQFEPTDTNCCVGINWTIADFVNQAGDSMLQNGLLKLTVKSGFFEPAHHLFCRIPGTYFVMTPLQPSLYCGMMEKFWSMDIGNWSILYDSKIMRESC